MWIPTIDSNQVKTWVEICKGLITIAGLLVGALWAWSRFVLERGLLPSSQMDLTLLAISFSESITVLEVGIQINNKGSSALVVTDLRIRLRYIGEGDEIKIIDKPGEAFGRLNFPHAGVLNGIGSEKRMVKGAHNTELSLGSGEFSVIPYDTFVQPGINQLYTFVTALPRASSYVLARASFRYQLRPTELQLWILGISRRLGMLQYSLSHINEPHTIERVFKISDEANDTETDC
jgi:hypothetical protein